MRRLDRTLCVFAIACAFTGSAVAATRPDPATSVDHAPRVCYSAARWSAHGTATVPRRFRPCVRVTAIQEDGSFSYAVSDADGTVRYSADIGALDR